MLVSNVTELQEEKEGVSLSLQWVTQMGKKEVTQEANTKEQKQDNNTGVSLEISNGMKSLYQQQAAMVNHSAEKVDSMNQMMEIARRISTREKVLPTDEKRLMEYNADLYQAAKATSILYTDEDKRVLKASLEETTPNVKVQKLSDLKREMNHGWGLDIGTSDSSVTVAGAEMKKM